MDAFRNQLMEDLELIKKEWGYMDKNIANDEYAFNYWILSRLYSIDEQLIPTLITEYNDKSIDCYVHFEESKELYIIQNKYYSEGTNLEREKASDFLTTPLNILNIGDYKRSKDLQKIFNIAKKDSSYKIWLHMYVSNTNVATNKDVQSLFVQYNCSNDEIKSFVGAEIFDLLKIKELYYGKRYKTQKKFTYTLNTKNRATSLNILPEEFNLPQMIKSHYIMTPVFELYDMYNKAEKSDYALFEENIREYLGTKGINNGIIKTLRNKSERSKFFYYNNGITIICKSSGKKNNTGNYSIELTDPQVVNGCQTINSIHEVLSSFGSEEEIKKEFVDTYVITKVLVFEEHTENEKRMYKDIVKYTNTQNAINEKAFASNNEYFENMKNEFVKRGLLLSVKPSDTNQFNNHYSDLYKFAELKKLSTDLFNFFEIDNNKISDYIIPLEKLLQVLLAFVVDGYVAFTKKNYVLKRSSKIYEEYSLKFHNYLSYDNMIKIYFLYKKAEKDKRLSEDKKTPIPYYVVDFISNNIDFNDINSISEKLNLLFEDKLFFDILYEFVKNISIQYKTEYHSTYKLEYNEMIKKEIDKSILEKSILSGRLYNKADFKGLF